VLCLVACRLSQLRADEMNMHLERERQQLQVRVCVCVHAHVLCCVGEHGWVIAFSHVLVCCCGRLRRLVNDWHDDR